MLKIFGCSNEEEALKAEARGLEEKKTQAEEKIVQLNNELNALKQKYADSKTKAETLSLEHGLCERKAREQSEHSNNRINELTSLLKLEVVKVERLTQEMASIEKDSKRDYSRLGISLEGLELQKRLDQRQFEDAMDQKQNAIEEMIHNYDQKITDLEHQLMYANMQLRDKEVLLQDIPPLHMDILSLKNQLQQAQTYIIGEFSVDQLKEELNRKNNELEKIQHQLEIITAVNTEHERLINVQQKQALTDAQEIVELRRQSLRVEDLEHQLLAAKKTEDSMQQLMNELSAMTAAKMVADQEIRRHLATIDDFTQSATKEGTGEIRIKELENLITTLTSQNHTAENNINSLTKQRCLDQDLLASNRRELDDANSRLQALKKQLMEVTAAKEAIEVQSARDHETNTLNNQRSKADMDAVASLHADNATLRADLAQKDKQMVDLGQIQLSDKATISELRNLLDASNKKQQALEDQLAVRTMKLNEEPATPVDASMPLGRSRSPSDMIPPKDLDVIPPPKSPFMKQLDPKDAKRLNDLELINETLLSFARDADFQQDLTRPLVKVAVALWKGMSTSHTDMESAKFDPGVIRLYPKLKAFEQQCASAGLEQFPIDHVEARRTELSAEAVATSFGTNFVSNHYLNRAVRHTSP